jgi:hypothetical protein
VLVVLIVFAVAEGYTFSSGLPWEHNVFQSLTPKMQFAVVDSAITPKVFLIVLMGVNILALMLWVRTLFIAFRDLTSRVARRPLQGIRTCCLLKRATRPSFRSVAPWSVSLSPGRSFGCQVRFALLHCCRLGTERNVRSQTSSARAY